MSSTSRNTEGGRSPSRVRVVPGCSLPSPPPPPPQHAPPKPSHLCKLAVVGDAYCGKSALIQKFIHRRYACDDEETDDVNHSNGNASATSNSIGTSLGTTSYDGLEPTLAAYQKKDITILSQYSKPNQEVGANSHGSGGEDDVPPEQAAVCVRVQLYDVNIPQHLVHGKSDSDNISLSHSIQSESSCARHTWDIKPLLPFLKRTNGILIACRCPISPSSSFSRSSIASYNSHTSDISSSEWPDLDALEQQIFRWKTFLNDTLGTEETQKRSILILLTCADLAIAGFSPKEWVRLSTKMQGICAEYNIDSWKIGTCMDTSKDHIVEETYSQSQTPTMLQKMMHQQRDTLMDLEDAIEGAFIDMINMYLQGQRE